LKWRAVYANLIVSHEMLARLLFPVVLRDYTLVILDP
jgi:hypothetical protein